jgi:DNA-binding MarR family transcriptional regulator
VLPVTFYSESMHDSRIEPLFADEPTQAPGDLPAEQQAVWQQFLSVALRLPTALESGLRQENDLALNDYLVLSLLAGAPNVSLRMSILAEASNQSGARTTQLVGRLEARGLVERRAGDVDARVIVATLTAEGLALLEAASPAYAKDVQARVFDRLTPDQIAQLGAIVAAIDTTPR